MPIDAVDGIISPIVRAVSYTHLDVYKRQTVAHYMRIRAPNAAVLAPMTDIRK